MKKKVNSIALLLILSVLGAAAAYAQDGGVTLEKAAAVLADSCRIMTDSDFAIVSRTAAQEVAQAQDGAASEAGTMYVKRLPGQEVYDLISQKIAEGGDSYPYFSGISAVTRTQSGSGGLRSEQLEELYVGEEPLDLAASYAVALSGDYAAAYEAGETLASYQPDGALLGKYLASYETGSGGTQQAGTASAEDDGPGTGDGAAMLQNQTPILLTAMSLLVIALAVYVILWQKKKKQDDENKSL